MKLTNNIFKDTREIKGFTQEDILKVKNEISKFKAENTDQNEIDDYLSNNLLRPGILEFYTEYIAKIEEFIVNYLDVKTKTDVINGHDNNYDLKSEILDEIILISNNLVNLSLNCRNTKRFLKNIAFLDELSESTQLLLDKTTELKARLEKNFKKIEKDYDNHCNLWIETNRIKDLTFKLNQIPYDLKNWQEIEEISSAISKLNEGSTKKKKKEKVKSFQFHDISSILDKSKIYSELIYLLFLNGFLEEPEEEDFINIIVKREIEDKLRDFMRPIINSFIKEKLHDILAEIVELDKTYKLDEEKKELNLNTLLDQKINNYLPQIVSYYFNGLEKKYQARINEVNELNEFNYIIDLYSEKAEIFSKIIGELEEKVSLYDEYLKPYENITGALKKTFSSLILEISRRRSEYDFYLKTVKKERLRDNINQYVSEKISELNEFISKYEDETSIIIREEFPQLKKIRDILNDYKEKVQQIKDEVYNKLDSFKEKEIDIYQIIKHWEDNFTRKKQQLSFLLSLLLNKIFKSFKDLIEEEELFFDTITDITDTFGGVDDLPLNFALSDILADKLTEEELKERIAEINAKLSKNEKITTLYQAELRKLEEILTTRIKSRQGITLSEVKCTICHKLIKLAEESDLIKCPYCESTYHYLCVAFWLSKYNSCPTCQNVFLDPNANLFDVEEE